MTTFKQFLQENDEPLKLRDVVRDLCPEIGRLYARADTMLYRGMKRPTSVRPYKLENGMVVNAAIITPRDDRRPTDMPEWAHDEIDDFFQDTFGVRARSRGVFCAPAYGTAGGYGDTVCAIFPIGLQHAIFSHDVEDLYTYLFPDHKSIGSKSNPAKHGPVLGHDYWMDTDDIPDMQDFGHGEVNVSLVDQVHALRKRLLDLHFADSIGGALKTRHETMIVCERYLAIELRDQEHHMWRLVVDGILETLNTV